MAKTRYGLEIRTATGADAAAVGELLSQVGADIPERALAERLDALRAGQGTALLALEWGPPSGMVVLHWHRTLGADEPAAQIDTLLVGPENRRRGIGRMLIKAAAQAARVAGCGTLTLLAPAEEPTLRAFCTATGFAEAGARFERALRKKG